MTKAVILAAGRGTRMQATPPGGVSAEQRALAARGLKPLIPFAGEPFLSYLLTTLAAAGLTDICLVVRPGDDPIRSVYAAAHTSRITLHFAVQTEPLGSAAALLAAESFVRYDDFILLNADNDYPLSALRALRSLDGPGLVAFSIATLLRGNIPADRIPAYALIARTADGRLLDIIEKPAPEQLAHHGTAALVSMTCWRFDQRIFDACRAIPRSVRGEYELPLAVRAAVTAGTITFRVLEGDAPVLDLSHPADIPIIERLLRGRTVSL